MILKVAIVDMNILNFNLDNSLSAAPNKNNTSPQLNSISASLKEETMTIPKPLESNDNLSKLISNSINSLI